MPDKLVIHSYGSSLPRTSFKYPPPAYISPLLFFRYISICYVVFFFFQAEDGIRDLIVTGVQTCALPISIWVAYADADSLVLVVERFTSDAGTDYPGLGTSVTIRRTQIGSLEERRVAKGRTILVLGGGVAAIVAIVASVGPLLGSSSGAPPPPPPQP